MNITNHNDEKLILNAANNAVVIQHAGATKIETATDGVVITGEVTANTFVGDGSGLTGIDTGATIARSTITAQTGILADDAAGDLNITAAKAYNLMSIQTDAAAWVRLYVTDAARTADASRNQNTDPAPDAGVIAEVITTGAQTILITPGVFGFNNEATVTNVIPAKVTNLSGASSTISVTIKILPLEI